MANNLERAGSNLPAPKTSGLARVVVFCSKPRSVAAGAVGGFLATDIGTHLIPVVGGLVRGPAEAVGVIGGAILANRVRKTAKQKLADRGIDD